MNGAVGQRLARVLGETFVTFHDAVTVEALSQTDWASVTFSGARHQLRAVLEGPGAVGAAADFLAALGDMELPIPGHIVADIALVAEERREGGAWACLELEALTIEDS